MTFDAKYRFDDAQVELMNVTISITSSLIEWRHLAEELKKISGNNQAAPLQHCVTNIVSAIDIATGGTYKTKGYTWDAATHLPDAPEAAA